MFHRRAIQAAVLLIVQVPLGLGAQASAPSHGASAPSQGASAPSQEALWSRALAVHFAVSTDEVSLLTKRGSSPNDVAVVLFLAHKSGVSVDAVVAARNAASGWDGVSRRFGLGAGTFHLPLTGPVRLAALRAAYRRYESTPPSVWTEIHLSDEAIATLVNLRVISKALRLPPDAVLTELRDGERFDQLFARLVDARTAAGPGAP